MTYLCLLLTFSAGLGSNDVVAWDIPKAKSDLIQLDGRLDEPAWRHAKEITDFRMRYPAERHGQPQYRTTALLWHTDKGLFVGFECRQPRESQIVRVYARDAPAEGDKVFVNLDVDGSSERGFYFLIGNGGYVEDGSIQAEKVFSKDWDGPWEATTRTTPGGWTAECYFPWDMFSGVASNEHGKFVRIFLSRWVESVRQEYSWPQILDSDPRHLELFEPVGIHEGVTARGLWVSPYATAIDAMEGGSSSEDAGVDLFWRPSQTFGLAATYRPDFGQVETDDLVINLGAYETFFEEKRPFFLKDRDLYAGSQEPFFYSRRIGAEGALDGALQATGTVGLLRYGSLIARGDNPSGDGHRDYGMMTGEVPFELGSVGVVAGASLARTQDYQGIAVRSNLSFAEGAVQSRWQLISTDNQGIGGQGVSSETTFKAKQNQRHSLSLRVLDASIDFNPMGYMRRNDERYLAYQVDDAWFNVPHLQAWHVTGIAAIADNRNGDPIERNILVRHYINDDRGHIWQFSTSFEDAIVDDRIARGNGDVELGSRFYHWASWQSDTRKPYGMRLYGAHFKQRLGHGSFSGRLSLIAQPIPNLSIRADFSSGAYDGFLLWEGQQRFSSHHVRDRFASVRMSWVPTRKQEVRVWGQYSDLRSEKIDDLVLVDRELGLDDQVDHGNLNINRFSFQARYRYELRGMSNLFVVYARGADYSSRAEPISAGELVRNPDSETFQIKINYLFR